MKALIADIHGNLEALRAVLDDIALHRVRDIYCLGDLVGYGPNPRECVDLLMDCPVVLLGDHDLAATRDQSFQGSNRSNLWTRRQLAIPTPDHDKSRRRREFLASLPLTHSEDHCLFVHGGPRDPVNEYVFPEDIYNSRKIQAVFDLVDRICFMGHTHVPGIFTEDSRFFAPEDIGDEWQLEGGKTLCNVGSVGQPRDGDQRACYVLFNGSTIRFRRVDYDIDTTLGKINDIDDFPRE